MEAVMALAARVKVLETDNELRTEKPPLIRLGAPAFGLRKETSFSGLGAPAFGLRGGLSESGGGHRTIIHPEAQEQAIEKAKSVLFQEVVDGDGWTPMCILLLDNVLERYHELEAGSEAAEGFVASLLEAPFLEKEPGTKDKVARILRLRLDARVESTASNNAMWLQTMYFDIEEKMAGVNAEDPSGFFPLLVKAKTALGDASDHLTHMCQLAAVDALAHRYALARGEPPRAPPAPLSKPVTPTATPPTSPTATAPSTPAGRMVRGTPDPATTPTGARPTGGGGGGITEGASPPQERASATRIALRLGEGEPAATIGCNVVLMGSWDDWSIGVPAEFCGDETGFVGEVVLARGSHAYKFVVNNEWQVCVISFSRASAMQR